MKLPQWLVYWKMFQTVYERTFREHSLIALY